MSVKCIQSPVSFCVWVSPTVTLMVIVSEGLGWM